MQTWQQKKGSLSVFLVFRKAYILTRLNGHTSKPTLQVKDGTKYKSGLAFSSCVLKNGHTKGVLFALGIELFSRVLQRVLWALPNWQISVGKLTRLRNDRLQKSGCMMIREVICRYSWVFHTLSLVVRCCRGLPNRIVSLSWKTHVSKIDTAFSGATAKIKIVVAVLICMISSGFSVHCSRS